VANHLYRMAMMVRVGNASSGGNCFERSWNRVSRRLRVFGGGAWGGGRITGKGGALNDVGANCRCHSSTSQGRGLEGKAGERKGSN